MAFGSYEETISLLKGIRQEINERYKDRKSSTWKLDIERNTINRAIKEIQDALNAEERQQAAWVETLPEAMVQNQGEADEYSAEVDRQLRERLNAKEVN